MNKLLILGAVLILLKATNILNISWWLVTLPLWIVPASVLSTIICISILIILAVIFDDFDLEKLPLGKNKSNV